ncbi:enoyl-CoA hydratase/isomerase family protein [Roseovarius sp. SCSIO 43702]|uniref:enoyl-CoA hydratase/isomerase family protein n=1 Tax=Roseovarius sp. SCSIO 43702 TaxID=2823043 RepID=UPI001C739F12|nr:enoyl-CoA hydratase/isomerase family protein [Roseovarius sp. SCSIO 43702]QYX56338.1 enoyl-CoA hydratase/isomerase family protein [Roseovarius sp. SCSIO 43702]
MTEQDTSSDIHIRTEGRAGRITLTRPKALNALTYDMALAIEDALDSWAGDDGVALVIIDAEGDKAFCAGGDVQKLYHTGRAGDFDYGRRFWRDEYRLNAKIAEYPKPYVAFMQGFTMGGGVGISCHGTHRVVCDSSRIAMPECGIGLVPDVGGSLLLARAPGRLGEYLALTTARMGPGDAIYAGFADIFIPQDDWPGLIARLCESGDTADIAEAGRTPPHSALSDLLHDIDAHFSGDTLADILEALRGSDTEFAAQALEALSRNSPLSMACAVEMLHRLRGPAANIRRALELEYRYTFRAMEHGDFLEGVRAAVIDKDRAPDWQHDLDTLPPHAATDMLMPLGEDALGLHKKDDDT